MHNDDRTDRYEPIAERYDRTLNRFDFFARAGFDLRGWRRAAVASLELSSGQHVVDLGCGTGEAFDDLRRAVGPSGHITGVDLSASMLDKARARVARQGWENVDLVQADLAEWQVPAGVDAVHSAYALILVPEPGRAMQRIISALAPGTPVAIIDMSWPDWVPLWWRHVLFFLRAYGVTRARLTARPWERVQAALRDNLDAVTRRAYWMGFFYFIGGRVPEVR